MELIRVKYIPRGIYGCETAPINEAALKTLQTRIVDTLTFTTTRRAVDLTLAVASHGTDGDPDGTIFKNRVVSCRRAQVISKENESMMEEIVERYLQNGEPGIM